MGKNFLGSLKKPPRWKLPDLSMHPPDVCTYSNTGIIIPSYKVYKYIEGFVICMHVQKG